MNRKGIELSTIAYLIIALVTIMLVIGLINLKITPSLKSVFCSMIRGVRSLLPLPESMKPSLPIYCEKGNRIMIETIEIETKDSDRISFLIASHIAACWEKTGKLELNEDVVCYELILKNGVDGRVTEDSVKDKLDLEYKDVYEWKAGIIGSRRSISISYEFDNKKIEVS